MLSPLGGGQRTRQGLDDLTRFGTPKDVTTQTVDSAGAVKVGSKSGETSKPRVYAAGKFFSPS